MKKQLLFVFLLISVCGQAQNSQTEKSITGLQIGLFGADIYNEARLSNSFVLRSELSIFPAIWGGDMYAETGFAFYPAITLQPKYYYSLSKRVKKGKNVRNNAANYLGLQLRYIPDWFVLSNSNVDVSNQVHVIPTFGIRRNFAKNFNYEFKAGVGYGTTIGYDFNESGAVLDLSFKVGFDF